MNPDWQAFLTRHGAAIHEGTVQHFGNPALELQASANRNVLCDLGQFSNLRVSGEEALTFLQNLLSNDIREVTGTHAQLSSLNSAKGRMLASMLIWRIGDDYMLQLPQVLSEPISRKLRMYVLRSKVKISDASDDVVSLGLSGPNSQEIIRTVLGDVPLAPLGVVTTFQASVIRIGDTRFQIEAYVQHAPSLWHKLSPHAQPAGSICWDWLNIRSGIPFIQPQTQELFVAQMVNFELIGGVSFKKGCYPGQEIVARTQYLGKLKRRMYLAHIEGSKVPQAGSELFSRDMEGQPSGMIVNAAPAPGGGCDVLASTQIESHDTQEIRLESLQGVTLQFLPLPYSLPME